MSVNQSSSRAVWVLLRVIVLATGVMSASAVLAQTATLTPARLEQAALELPTGRALWSDVDPGTGPVAIVISLPLQVAYVYRGPELIGVSSVSTGKAGKETPTGSFEILQKRVFHRSNLYSNAPMPFMQRLTWDGIALHAGDNPGYPASHGCIRFPTGFAKKLFDLTAMGGAVAITNEVVIVPPGGRAPRLVPPPGSFSFGSEPVIASRPAAPAPVRAAPPPRPAVRTAPDVPVVAIARADPAPRLIPIGFEPVRR